MSNAQKKQELPDVIGVRIGELAPLVERWIKDHPGASWGHLLKNGMKKELKPYAGKRYAHLVQ